MANEGKCPFNKTFGGVNYYCQRDALHDGDHWLPREYHMERDRVESYERALASVQPVNIQPVKHGYTPNSEDPVNHPKHYSSHPSGIECIEITRHLNFNIGNAVKYLWRAGIKDEDTHVQDLEKAIWYIKDEIERLKKNGQGA